MTFADIELSKRLERAEGDSCAQFAMARRRLDPACGSEWMMHAGAYGVFDGVDSPTTQTFGLGIFEELSAATLEVFEEFFFSRGAHVDHEISPLAGVPALDLLCGRGYRPIEVSNVMIQRVHPGATDPRPEVRVRVIEPDEGPLWTDICVRGWSHGHPELADFLQSIGTVSAARERTTCFLAEIDGIPAAAASFCLSDGIALFAGSTTVPELRRRGLQTALLHERMRHAHAHSCDLAMIVAAPGSDSHRNADRTGFRVAYTRIKWRLPRQ